MRTRVKICGITHAEDMRLAVSAGADALGFNFYPQSPRYLDPGQAARLLQQVPPYVTRVGLFVNESAPRVKQICDRVHLDMLQFHGDEARPYCEQFGMAYMKAIRFKLDMDLSVEIAKYPGSQGILIDTYDVLTYGGTGKPLDWSGLRPTLSSLTKPLVLAGGLNAANVSRAIRLLQPWGVDVSSGVEIERGKKDPDKVLQFIHAVNMARE